MPAFWGEFEAVVLGLAERGRETLDVPANPRSRTRRPTVGVAVAPAKSTSWPVAAIPACMAGTNTGAEGGLVGDKDRAGLAKRGIGGRELGDRGRVQAVADNSSQS